ncbi:DNA polymerase III subunit delta [Adlercreutzia sp. ZJ154]|uniref:DNA polymerase III subunit delta n=1 Tax=Adlercreutzia sp. ZJ154 TaxID=2709790 RepID=UPI0013E9DF42|nr:DNA polymerase III subunit delta [Adlercreutzia sp. ZJ154]
MANKQEKELLPAYLVVGDDALKREAVMKRMRMRLEKLGDLSFNSDTFDGSQCSGIDIVSACNTVPFASQKRLVQVNAADKLRKAGVDAVCDYLKNANTTTVLMLLAEKLAKNTKLYKTVSSLGADAVIDCAQPKSYKMQAHVRAMAPTHGITMTDDAAAKLIELVGTDTVRLDNEIKKLASAHRGSDAVNVNEVIALVADTSVVKPWEFVDAFAARNMVKCLNYLPKVGDSSPIALLSMSTSKIRELMCAQSLLASGGSTAQIASELGVPEWKVKNHAQWARRFSESDLRRALISSMHTEQKMKSGTPADAALRDWVVNTLAK